MLARNPAESVETVLGFPGTGDFREEILEQYPSLKGADIDACQRFAADTRRWRSPATEEHGYLEMGSFEPRSISLALFRAKTKMFRAKN